MLMSTPLPRSGRWRLLFLAGTVAPRHVGGERWRRRSRIAGRDGTPRASWSVRREEHPISACSFSGQGLNATIAKARLDAAGLEGAAARGAHSISWSLAYASSSAPLLLLPERLYEGGLPKAKALVGAPLARYDGHLVVNGTRTVIDGWVGSQNHNWGVEHTTRYAWGQVAGFDDAPEAFLEVTTARVRVGLVLTPSLTVQGGVGQEGPSMSRATDDLLAADGVSSVTRYSWMQQAFNQPRSP